MIWPSRFKDEQNKKISVRIIKICQTNRWGSGIKNFYIVIPTPFFVHASIALVNIMTALP
jgi:hypothetical protein